MTEEDIGSVVRALRSDYLTTGPLVAEFEEKLAAAVGAGNGVAVCNGTAALHTAVACLGVGPGDEVIVPAMTFVATANAVLYCGARPIFADVDPDRLLLSASSVKKRLSPRTRLIVSVDYAGQPCDYAELRELARENGISLLADACHSLGACYQEEPVGSLADATVFSFHPVKPITTAEGGMITTSNPILLEKLRQFRDHGVDRDFRSRQSHMDWRDEMVELGFNYRLSDVHSALGLSQLDRCEDGLRRRNEIARRYRDLLRKSRFASPLEQSYDRTHSYHLFVIRVDFKAAGFSREDLFQAFAERRIRLNVHYLPVHLHAYYRRHLGTGPGLCPVAEEAYEQIVSLPVFGSMEDWQVDRVCEVLEETLG